MDIRFEESTTSFESLFASLRDRVLAYAKKVGDPDLAEDVVQETFLRLLRYKKGNLGPITFSFILTMTRNVARTMHAKLSREPKFVFEGGDVAEVRSDPVRPNGALEVVYEVLDRMPERQREALYLTEVCGLSEIQAALAMAMSRAAINARKRDALCKLRQCVDHALRTTASGEHGPTATGGTCSSSSDRPAMCA
jgi:RNA polymerase sigma factor (sigma-70 family)